MYVAVLLACAGAVLGYADDAAWSGADRVRAALWVSLAVVLHAKARIEERELGMRFAQYADYAARTKRFVPFVL
jgi:protein-S-isoprenylcysteine O-methyltransferase Ste14